MPELRGVMYAYPWDVYDHGPSRVLDELQECGMDAVQLSFSYHVATFFNPRNPRRKLRYGEPGVLEFDPRGSPAVAWPFEPVVSRDVTGERYLKDLLAALSGRGLGVIAWVVYLYNHTLARRRPDLAVENAFGSLSEAHLCPANPAVREYALALTQSVLAHSPLSGLVAESLSYAPYDHGVINLKAAVAPGSAARMLLSLCFCSHCSERAAVYDVDVTALRREVIGVIEKELADLPDGPAIGAATEAWCRESHALTRLLDARAEVASSLQRTVLTTARDAGLRTSTNSPGAHDERLTGVASASVSDLMSDVRCDVVPHITAAEIARTIATADQCGGTGATVFGLTQVGMFADESTFRSALETAASSGIRQFRFYEYGLLSERHLTWLRNAKGLWR